MEYEFGVAACHSNLAYCFNRSGQFQRARAAAEKAVALWTSLGTEAAMPNTLVNLGVAERGCGDEERAIATFERAAELLGAGAEGSLNAEVLSQLALSQLQTGRIVSVR